MDQALYAIKIAASMEGGVQTSSQMDRLAQSLMGGGKSAEFFQRAQQTVSADLEAARGAAQAAKAAFAGVDDRYREVEVAAVKAAEAVAKLEGRIESQAAKVVKDQAALEELRTAQAAAGAQARKLAEDLARIAEAGAGLEGAKEAARQASVQYSQVAKQVSGAEKAYERSGAALARLRALQEQAAAQAKKLAADGGSSPGADKASRRALEQLAKLSDQVAIAEADFAQAGASLDGLRAAQTAAGEQARKLAEELARVAEAGKIPPGVEKAARLAGEQFADLSRQVANAEKAVERSGAALGEMQDNLAATRADADAAQAEMAQLAPDVERLGKASDDASEAERRLAATLGNVGRLAAHADRSIAGQAESLGKLQGGLSAIGGPLGTLGATAIAPTKAFAELSSVMGESKAMALVAAVGIAAVGAAIAAVGVAAIAGAAKLASWGVGLADAARSAGLVREAAEALDPRLASLRDAIWEIEGGTGVAEPRLRVLANTLLGAKVPADRMVQALDAAAIAEAALGEGGADQFIDRMKRGQLSVRAFANEVDAKFSGIVERKMLGLEAQSTRLKSNLGRTFGGLQIEPALRGLDRLGKLFDADTASGRAMKFLFEQIFQPFIDGADEAATVLEAFVLGVEIGLVKLYIAAKPAIKWLKDLLGLDDTSLPDVLKVAKIAGEALAFVIAGMAAAFVVAGAAIGAVVAVLATVALGAQALALAGVALAVVIWTKVAAAFRALPEVIADVVEWFGQLPSVALTSGMGMLRGFGEAIDGVLGAVAGFLADAAAKITGVDWIGLGASMIEGLVQGILGGASRVAGAMGDVAAGALRKAKEVLGIASPSKRMHEIGDNTAEGAVDALEDRTADVQTAMADMVEPPEGIASVIAPQGAINDNGRRALAAGVAERIVGMDRGVIDLGVPGAQVGGATSVGAPAEGGSAGKTIRIGKVSISISGAGDPAAVAREVERVLTEFLERDAASLTGAAADDVDDDDLAGAA